MAARGHGGDTRGQSKGWGVVPAARSEPWEGQRDPGVSPAPPPGGPEAVPAGCGAGHAAWGGENPHSPGHRGSRGQGHPLGPLRCLLPPPPPRLEEGWAPPAQHPKSAPAASGVPGSGDGVLALGTLVALGDGRRCRAVLDTGTAAGGSVGVSAPGTGSHSECRKHQRHRGRGRAELWGLSWLDTNPRAGLTMAPRRNC